MRAVILAGGEGKRLYPYTLVMPKPLIPIGELPIIEVVIKQLAARGFRRLSIAVGYHAELIMAVMRNGEKWDIQIDYTLEDKPRGTIGPLKQIPNLDDPFLVMNGDLLTDIHYEELMAHHLNQGCIATVATCKRHVKISLGVLNYDDKQRITSFEEKPEFDYDVSMGCYIFDPRILDYIPDDEYFGFDQLMHTLLKAGEPVAVYPFNGNWLDMGTPEDLARAVEEFERHRERYLPHG